MSIIFLLEEIFGSVCQHGEQITFYEQEEWREAISFDYLTALMEID